MAHARKNSPAQKAIAGRLGQPQRLREVGLRQPVLADVIRRPRCQPEHRTDLAQVLSYRLRARRDLPECRQHLGVENLRDQQPGPAPAEAVIVPGEHLRSGPDDLGPRRQPVPEQRPGLVIRVGEPTDRHLAPKLRISWPGDPAGNPPEISPDQMADRSHGVAEPLGVKRIRTGQPEADPGTSPRDGGDSRQAVPTASCNRKPGLALTVIVCYTPQADKLTVGLKLGIAGLHQIQRRELDTPLNPAQVTGVVPDPDSQTRKRKLLPVPVRAQFRAKQVQRRPLGSQDLTLLAHVSLP